MATRRIAVWLLAFALFAAQSLGLLHRVAHPSDGTPTAVAAQERQGSWAQHLFVGHEGEPSCKLFDQLGASGVLPDVPVLHSPVLAPLHFLTGSFGQALCGAAAQFDARGPPATR